MKMNVGKADRIVRIVLGLVIIGIGVWLKSWWGLIGLIPLGTALINFCPIYHLLGVSTCRIKPIEKK